MLGLRWAVGRLCRAAGFALIGGRGLTPSTIGLNVLRREEAPAVWTRELLFPFCSL